MSTLDIILPCYNPGAGWTEHIIKSWQLLQQALPDVQMQCILVNDGSTKGVQEADITALSGAIPRFMYIPCTENAGKGHALRTGVARSEADHIVYTDVDFPYTIESMLKVIHALQSDQADIAAGIKDASYYAHVPAFRRFISKLLRMCTAGILGLKVSDTQCGLKGFNQRGKALFMRTEIRRYLFDLEFIFLASRDQQVRLLPVQVTLREHVQFSQMRMRILLQEGGNFIRIIFRSIFK